MTSDEDSSDISQQPKPVKRKEKPFIGKHTVVALGLCMLLAIGGVGLIFFGPASEETSICRICGKERIEYSFLGCMGYEGEEESELSEWYQHVGMQEHDHQWTHSCSWEREWGGGVVNHDSFGWELGPLSLLKSTTSLTDPATAKELVGQFDAAKDDAAKDELVDRCHQILRESTGPHAAQSMSGFE